MREKTLVLILDRNEYREKEDEIRRQLGEIYRNIEFFYTTYETKLIRRVRKWKFVGKALQHILYWGLSYKFAREIYKSAANKDVLSINPIVAIFLGIKNKQRKFGLTMCGFLLERVEKKEYQIFYYGNWHTVNLYLLIHYGQIIQKKIYWLIFMLFKQEIEDLAD